MVTSFKELIVWQRAMGLVVAVYAMTARLPEEEKWIIVSQIKRATLSISSNIAEGSGRKTTKDYLHFLRIADGSACETESLIHAINRLYPRIDCRNCSALLDEVQRMLATMIRKLGYLT